MALLTPLQAAPLGISQSFPDFVVNVSGGANQYIYDEPSKTLTIAGTISGYSETSGGSQYSVITNSSFSLTATFSNLTNCPGPLCDADVTGSFALFGEIHALPFNSVLYDGFDGGFFTGGDPLGLLQGDLLDFGWASSGGGTGDLEFTFGNTSGFFAYNPGAGQLTQGATSADGYKGGGMRLNLNTSSLPNMNDLLTNSGGWSGTGVGNVWLPVPAAVWLFGSGLVGLLGVGIRRRRSA